MKTINLEKYGPVLSSRTVGNEIYQLIKNEMEKHHAVCVELSAIKSMATFCAKQIFGKLYLELGSEMFFERISLKDADEDIKTIIQIGIQHALQEVKK